MSFLLKLRCQCHEHAFATLMLLNPCPPSVVVSPTKDCQQESRRQHCIRHAGPWPTRKDRSDWHKCQMYRLFSVSASSPHVGPQFHRMFRMWWNLMALKWGGRGHDPAGIDAMSTGELLLECPACPYPECNLPVDWEKASALLWVNYKWFKFRIIIIFVIDSSMYCILLSMVISSSKGSNGISRMWSLCQGGGLLCWNRTIKPMLQIVLINLRFMPNIVPRIVNLTKGIKTDKYMQIPAWCPCPSGYSLITWLRCL